MTPTFRVNWFHTTLIFSLACSVLADEPVSFDLLIQAGRLERESDVIQVTEGSVVELNWRSDSPVSLHLHGYDIEIELAPDSPGLMTFTAHATGRFPVSIHEEAAHRHSGEQLIHKPLAYLEVHPR